MANYVGAGGLPDRYPGSVDTELLGGITFWEKVGLWCIPLGVIALVVALLRW